MRLQLKSLAGGYDAEKWSDLIEHAQHGPDFQIDGHSVLGLALDAQRWDVIDRVLCRDVRGTLETIRRHIGSQGGEEAWASYWKTFLKAVSETHSMRYAATVFPIDFLLDEDFEDDVDRVLCEGLYPTPNNPAPWDFPGTDLLKRFLAVWDDDPNESPEELAMAVIDGTVYADRISPASFTNARQALDLLAGGEQITKWRDILYGEFRADGDEHYLVFVEGGWVTVKGSPPPSVKIGDRVSLDPNVRPWRQCDRPVHDVKPWFY
jgi:hypothetical protein